MRSNARKPPVPPRRPAPPPVAASALVDEAHRCVSEDMSSVSTLLALASKYEQNEDEYLAQSSRSSISRDLPPQATKEGEYQDPQRQFRELRTPLRSSTQQQQQQQQQLSKQATPTPEILQPAHLGDRQGMCSTGERQVLKGPHRRKGPGKKKQHRKQNKQRRRNDMLYMAWGNSTC